MRRKTTTTGTLRDGMMLEQLRLLEEDSDLDDPLLTDA